MSHPSRVTLDPIDSDTPRRTKVLRPSGSAHIRLTHVAHSTRAATHPADLHTHETNAIREKLTRPGLTNDSPYQARPLQRVRCQQDGPGTLRLRNRVRVSRMSGVIRRV